MAASPPTEATTDEQRYAHRFFNLRSRFPDASDEAIRQALRQNEWHGAKAALVLEKLPTTQEGVEKLVGF